MRLLPAMIVVVLLFLGGLVFLQVRASSRKGGGIEGLRMLANHRFARAAAILLLILMTGLLFRIMGKIALLIGVLFFFIYLLSSRKRQP